MNQGHIMPPEPAWGSNFYICICKNYQNVAKYAVWQLMEH